MASASSPLDGAPPADAYDPTFVHSRREALIIVSVWTLCLVWAVPYCYFNGYVSAGEDVDPAALETVWGIPSWAFYGIGVPWLLADVFTTWFCFCYMKDDDLGEGAEEPSGSETPPGSDGEAEEEVRP